jgi:hypothetical protein
MRLSIENTSEIDALGDLAQIEGLVEWRTRTGWTPLVPGDLPDRAGRQLTALRDSVLVAANLASDNRVRNGSGDYGPGRWVQTSGGQTFWTGLWLRGWSDFGASPVWATVEAANSLGVRRLETALSQLKAPTGPGLYRSDAKTWAVPLMVPMGAEQGDVASALDAQLRRISDMLDAMPHLAVSAPAGVDGQATINAHPPAE